MLDLIHFRDHGQGTTNFQIEKCVGQFLYIPENSVFFKHKKVKCTLVRALRLCTGHTACRGSRSIALPFHDHSTRRR
jgi:hypothetical protein